MITDGRWKTTSITTRERHWKKVVARSRCTVCAPSLQKDFLLAEYHWEQSAREESPPNLEIAAAASSSLCLDMRGNEVIVNEV